MNEITIAIEGISLVEFYGVDNAKFNILKQSFPKLKLVPRGAKLKVIGSESDISLFKEKLDRIFGFVGKYGTATIQHVEEILAGLDPTSVPTGNEDVIIYGPKGNLIKARTYNQKRLVKEVLAKDIVFAVGPAGTGKTYTSVAMAVRALKNNLVKRIVLTRPAVEAGESLGFLPGDLKDKIDPYLRPLYDALDDMFPPAKLNYYMENRIIEIAPLAYMRGRTINDAFIILDEAQNATSLQLKMFLTRLGPSAKCVITGDMTQVDLPRSQKSGLKRCLGILEGIEGIGTIYLTKDDVIRHKLVKRIIQAYEEDSILEEEREYKESQERKRSRDRILRRD